MIDLINCNYNLGILAIEKNEESTDGNVYIANNEDSKYVIKVYDTFEHTNMMINVHNALADLYIPKIVKTIDDSNYYKIGDKYGVIYTFLNGTQICNMDFYDIIPLIAKEVRKMHNKVTDNSLGIRNVPFDVDGGLRTSVLHFDLTKSNVFYDDGKIGFIDFDDVKFGPSICEISIIISLLFMSKKKGINKDGIKIFIDSYYGNDVNLKEKELKYLKEYAIKWVDYLLDNHSFDSSLKESFEVKRKLICEYL